MESLTAFFKKYFTKTFLAGLLRNYAVKAIAGLSGWQAVLAKYALRFGWKNVEIFIGNVMAYATMIYTDAKNKMLKKRDQKDAIKYEETLKDGKTEDEQKDATTDLLNG